MGERSDSGPIERVFDIVNQRGLHARASAKFVKLAESFDAVISVSKGDSTVGGTSIMGLMMLAAGQGSKITISAEGEDAEQALNELGELINSGFSEED